MQLVLLGPPGAGKGTVAARLAATFPLTHISTGDLLRAEVAAGTALGRKVAPYMKAGQLVPQDLLGEVVARKLATTTSFVLDGYPRTVEQAEFLASLPGVSLDAVVYLRVDREEVVRRLARRRVCPVCGATTAADETSPSTSCPACGAKLARREDDDAARVTKRFEVYLTETTPVVEFYRARGILKEVDGGGTREEVWRRVVDAVAAAR